ncbi:MAG: AAA family ATPase [Thermacetogeniaceae bacterium]
MRQTLEKARRFQERLASNFMEREEVAEGILLALVTRQHVLLLGPPGSAKSAIIEFAARQVAGARYFRWLFTRFTTPEELFGPVSLQALQEDSYRRKTARKLPEAEIAFIDEIFKANSAILNAMLSLINERIFFNDGEAMQVPLISMFAASNELPEAEEEAALRALADRFLLRYIVSYVTSRKSQISLLLQEEPQPEPILSLSDLEALHAAARKVAFPKEAAEALIAIVDAVRREGVEVSDRRMKQCVLLLQAKALLEGEDAVEPEEHFSVLRHALWTSPEQRDVVAQVVIKIANPLEAEIEEIARAVREAVEAWARETDQKKKLAALSPLPRAEKQLRAIAAKLPRGSSLRERAERLIEEIGQQKVRLSDDVLSIAVEHCSPGGRR